MNASQLLVMSVVAISLALSGSALGVSIETVLVGNPGNAGELSGEGAGGRGPDRTCGSVDYVYRMGKYEITAAQYRDFLNAVASTDTYGLYHPYMDYDADPSKRGCNIKRSGSSGSYTYTVDPVDPNWANRPVNYVRWGAAVRFANWLTNGQPTGAQDLSTTEDGSYYLNGATTREELMAVTRKANARWVIPTEDEWYKAAYYDGPNAVYYDYPTGTNSVPSNDLIDPDPGNNANFDDGSGYTIGSPYYRTPVGEFENSESPYGTFDQAGNDWEWNESVIDDPCLGPYPYRCMRGGGFNSYAALHASYRAGVDPTYGSDDYGFRVAEILTKLTLTVVNPTWGTLDIEPNDPNWEPFHFPVGTSVTLAATPIEGKCFGHWEVYDPNYPGDANYVTVDANNSTTIVMNSDLQVRAVFGYLLTLTVSGSDKGSVTVEPNEISYVKNATVTLIATWDSGRYWLGWEGDVPPGHERDNPLTITMDSDKTISTSFKCGVGLGPMLPLAAMGLLGMVVVRRRRR